MKFKTNVTLHEVLAQVLKTGDFNDLPEPVIKTIKIHLLNLKRVNNMDIYNFNFLGALDGIKTMLDSENPGDDLEVKKMHLDVYQYLLMEIYQIAMQMVIEKERNRITELLTGETK